MAARAGTEKATSSVPPPAPAQSCGTKRRGRLYSMIGLVIVTHCGLAQEFRSALEHVVGPQTQLETVSIGPDDDMALRRSQIVDAIKRTNTGEGVIVLVDMFGGTPSNLAISVMDEDRVEVIAGINLP